MSRAFLWGRFVDLPPLTAAAAERLCRQAEARREPAAARHFWKTLDVLDAVGRLWVDPRSTYRRRAQALMPKVSGFSPATVRRTLELIPDLLDKRSLRKRVAVELGRGDALDAWSLDPEGAAATKAFPLGAVLHVAAGNIFLGCIDSVVMSLLTNNVTILRLSSSDTTFPRLFAESLAQADKDRALTPGLAVLSWPKADKTVEEVFKRRLQGVVVWGGSSAVEAYQSGLGVGAKLIAFGPKLSFGVISKEGLRRFGAREAARRAARDISWWDQAACASPQTLFVQDHDPRRFLAVLGEELERVGRADPPGPATPDEAAAILEERQRALAAELSGRGRLIAPKDLGWTIAWSRRPALKASPLRRFIHVCPYKDLAQLAELARGSAPYLQSAGLLVGAEEPGAYADALAAAGASRTPELGRMLESETGDPHDGRYPLTELVRWVAGPPAAVASNGNRALEGLLEQAAAESPFYRRRLKGNFETLPLLDKDDLYAQAPPKSQALLTRAGDGRGRVVFASGGSTGKPKFCFYTQDEFEETCRWLAWGLRRSGLEPGDVIGNLFVAGNLWSSFMAISGAARALSATHLPIAGTADPELMLDSLRRFKANALIGLPSTLLDLARRANGRLKAEKIFYAGEHASDAMRREWTRAFGARLIRSAGYASVDAGLIGFQCGDCAGAVHHAAAGLQHVELVDDKGRPAARGEAGEIVVTNLIRRWMPIIRYRTGDLGRWLPEPCPCGHPSPRFVLLGRCDDRVNVGGAHLDVGDVGKAVAKVPGLSLFYQLVVEPADELTVRVERRAAGSSDGLASKLSSALLAASHELRDSVARGWFRAPKIELLAPGGLARQPRTGKVRRVVDRR